MRNTQSVGRSRVALALVLLATACAGGETGNPPSALDTFDSSACKGEALAKSADPASLVSSSADDPRYEGLNCVIWERSADHLGIEVTNHGAGCGLNQSWEPTARYVDDGHLELRLENPSCSVARCGSCIYDLSFVLSAPPAKDDLELTLFGDSCNGPATVEQRLRLPLATQASGELCTLTGAGFLRWHACQAGSGGGTRFAPCTASEGADCYSEGDWCQGDLVCTAIGSEDARCLPSCQSDADCAAYASTRCVESTCRPLAR